MFGCGTPARAASSRWVSPASFLRRRNTSPARDASMRAMIAQRYHDVADGVMSQLCSIEPCVVMVPLETRREARLRVPGAGGSGSDSSTEPSS